MALRTGRQQDRVKQNGWDGGIEIQVHLKRTAIPQLATPAMWKQNLLLPIPLVFQEKSEILL
jgi:hypothetical protein